MDDDNDNSIKLSPEKNTKKSTKRMKDKIKIQESRKSEKSTIEGKEIILSNNDLIKYKENEKEKEEINNKKKPYYKIEKLPKEDKGKKGKKNLFLNDSLKGSIIQATRKKLGKIFFTKRKKNKNNEYLETENTTTDATLEKEKKLWIDKDLVPKKIIRIKIQVVYTEIAPLHLEVQEIQMLNGIL